MDYIVTWYRNEVSVHTGEKREFSTEKEALDFAENLAETELDLAKLSVAKFKGVVPTARLDAISAGYVSVEQERDERGLKEWHLEPCTGALAAPKSESGAIAWDYLPGRTVCTVEEAGDRRMLARIYASVCVANLCC